MDKYLKKQIIIAVIFLLIIGSIVGIVYFLIKGPVATCSDGIQNQGEEGIDCGGPCKSCPEEVLEDIEILWTKALSSPGAYDVVAKIKNPNRDYGAASFSYTFKITQNGQETFKEGTSYILPQETKYIIEPRVLTAFSAIFSGTPTVELEIKNLEWEKLKEYVKPEFFIRDKNYQLLGAEESGYSRISGIVENKSNFDFDKLDVKAVLFSENQQVIGVGKTEMRTLLAFEERYFEIKWFNAIEKEVVNFDLEAETNVFLQENFMRRYGEPGKFKEY